MKNVFWLCLVGLALVGGAVSASAQSWVAKYSGGDACQPYKIKVDTNGNTYVLGLRIVGGNESFLLLKYNTAGAFVWGTNYTSPAGGVASPTDMALDGNGNIYVTGTADFGTFDIVTIKYDPSGATQWVKTYKGVGNDNESVAGLKVDGSGNVYVAGTARRSSDDVVVLKYNTSGVMQWVTAYNGASNGTELAKALALDSSNNVVVVGQTHRGAVNGVDYLTLKLDHATGAIQWVQVYNGTGSNTDIAYGVAVDSSDSVVVTGSSRGSSNLDYVTLKYNNAGAVAWAKRYDNGVGDDTGKLVTTGVDGTVYVTGFSAGTGTSFDWATLKYSPSGVVQWTKRTRTGGSDSPASLHLDGFENVYVTGFITGDTSGGTTGMDAYTAKYNAAGTSLFSQRYSGATSASDEAMAMAVSGGDIYICVRSLINPRNHIVTIKYDLTP